MATYIQHNVIQKWLPKAVFIFTFRCDLSEETIEIRNAFDLPNKNSRKLKNWYKVQKLN